MTRKTRTNMATEGFTAIQAGEILPPSKGAKPKTSSKPGKGSGRVTNIQSGKGRVGLQAHTILGDLHIEM
ncbi:hypothetical protein [Nonomuraea sp. KM90]|uniref:hypothetical protein n=1 Tax=Nonomuraea sp. KM90 TaxID=3457428 RepID=UPI003FCD5184